VASAEWAAICGEIAAACGRGAAPAGLLAGIERIHALLARHFPPRAGDTNELPDQPVVL
jgi:putative membrane protein